MAGPVHLLSARLQSETPVSGVPLEPYILCRRNDSTTVSAEEVPQEGQTDGRFSIKSRWYRSVVTKGGQVRWERSAAAPAIGFLQRPRQPPRCSALRASQRARPASGDRCRPAPPALPLTRTRPAPSLTPHSQVCWAHPEKEAAIQCILCLRCKADVKKSYHCSADCLREHWHFHKDFHTSGMMPRAADSAGAGGNANNTNGGGGGYGTNDGGGGGFKGMYTYSNSGETWVEVGRERAFSPGPDDVGAIRKSECTAYDAASPYPEVGKTFSIVTARVRPGAWRGVRRGRRRGRGVVCVGSCVGGWASLKVWCWRL